METGNLVAVGQDKDLNSPPHKTEIVDNFLTRYVYIIDIDECQGVNNCDSNANCTNTQGSFTCSCQEGYSGDGKSCSGEILFYLHTNMFLFYLRDTSTNG